MELLPANDIFYAINGSTSPLFVAPPPLIGIVQSNVVMLGFSTADHPELGKPAGSSGGAGGPGGGQYIEIIVDDDPSSTHIVAELPVDLVLRNGTHLIQYFLSSGDGEVVRTGAHVGAALVHINERTHLRSDDVTPMIIYNLPRCASRARATVVDFAILNVEYNGANEEDPFRLVFHMIRVTIDGVHVFNLEYWRPYFVEGLGVGTHTIQLELVLREGNVPLGSTYPRALTNVRTFDVV